MAGLSTGAGPPAVNVYHEKSMLLPDVSRVLACLYEKKVEFKTIRASYKDILSLQASRSVPVPFYDGPVFLQDSRAICRYIAEKYEHQGYPFLLGKDVLERASIEQWLRHEERAFDPPSRALFCHLAFPSHDDNNDDDDEKINREKQKLEEVLEVYEQRLGESRFLAGNKFTLADLVHLPGTHHVITSDKFAYLYDSRKNVQRWWEEISARDSWQDVLKYMRTVEEEHFKEEELEQQKQLEEWQTEPSQPYSGRDIHIDHRRQLGAKPKTVLVAPPSTGATVTSISPTPQDHGTTSDHKPSSPIQPYAVSKRPPSEAHDKPGYLAIAKPSSQAAAPDDKTSPGTAKTSHKTDEPDSTKPLGVRSLVDQPSPLQYPTKPDIQKPQTPYAKPPEQRVADTSVGPEPGERQKRELDSPHARGEAARQSPYTGGGPAAAAKRATEADQDRAASSPAQKAPASVQDAQQRAQGLSADQKGPGASPQVKSEDTEDGTEDETFSTKRLRRMFDPDAEGSQAPAMEEEAPVYPKKPSDLHHREKQTTAIPASKELDSSPSAGAGTPYTPDAADGRGDMLPPKGVPRNDRVTSRPEKTSPIQQVPPAPSTDKLAKTEGIGTGTPQKTPTDARSASTLVQGGAQVDEKSDKSSTVMGGRAPELSTRKTPTSDSRGSTSASVQETIIDARGKQATSGQEDFQGVGHNGDDATTKKPVSDNRAAEPTSGSQQTTKRDQGVRSATSGVPGDKSTIAATTDPSAALPAQVKVMETTVSRAGNLDANGKNEEAQTPPAQQRSKLPSTPGGPAPTPDTEFRTTSDPLSSPSPPLPSLSDTRNEKIGLAETSQTSAVSPNEQLVERAPRNTAAPSPVTSPKKSREDNNEMYKERAAEQQLPRDQSRGQLTENKKQNDDAAQVTEIGKPKEDLSANASNKNTGQPQATSTNTQSKLQIQSDQNKLQLSNDGRNNTREAANAPNLETSKELLPSPPEKSMQQQQLQRATDRSAGMSLKDNANQGSETTTLGSGTEQKKNKDLPTTFEENNGKTPGEVNSEEKTSSSTQQVRNNRSDGKSGSLSNPTQSEGNKDNFTE